MTEVVTQPQSAETPSKAPPPAAGKRDVALVFWIVPGFYALFGIIFFALARVMPPPRPDITQSQMVDFFTQHATTIQIGFCALILIVGGAGVSNGIVVFHMKRMTTGSPMAYAYMGGMAVGALPGCLLVACIFLVATFRPDRNPAHLALLYDLGLLSYVGSLGCFTVAYCAMAVAILYDRNEIFPKWLAYVSIWQVVTEVMAVAVFVSKAGAFAWNGSISFYMGTVIFGVWLSAVIMFLKRATQRQPLDEAPLP